MLLHHMDFCGIWLKQNTLWQFQLDRYQPGTRYSMIWKETPAALGARTFIWIVTIPRIREKIPHPMPKFWRIPLPGELSNPGSRPDIYHFPRFPHRILVKSRIPKIPFQTLCLLRGIFFILEREINSTDSYLILATFSLVSQILFFQVEIQLPSHLILQW